MKQIRRGVFETNSSSTHSITMCMKSDFDRWKAGEVYLNDGWNSGDCWITKEEALELISDDQDNPIARLEKLSEDDLTRELREYGIYTYDSYDSDYLEGYQDEFTTPSGETVVAFGQYGFD